MSCPQISTCKLGICGKKVYFIIYMVRNCYILLENKGYQICNFCKNAKICKNVLCISATKTKWWCELWGIKKTILKLSLSLSAVQLESHNGAGHL